MRSAADIVGGCARMKLNLLRVFAAEAVVGFAVGAFGIALVNAALALTSLAPYSPRTRETLALLVFMPFALTRSAT
jgi:hypothetical protein